MSRQQLRRIVATLAVIFAVGFLMVRHFGGDDTLEKKARAEVSFWSEVVKNYHLETGRYPAPEEGLAVFAREGYVRRTPTDPWGRPFGYAAPGPQGAPFEIWSTGQDGAAHLGPL